jgi:hypothetical protein
VPQNFAECLYWIGFAFFQSYRKRPDLLNNSRLTQIIKLNGMFLKGYLLVDTCAPKPDQHYFSKGTILTTFALVDSKSSVICIIV